MMENAALFWVCCGVLIVLLSMAALDPSLTRAQLNQMWDDVVDPGHKGSVNLSSLHETLGARFGKDKSANKANVSVVDRVIAKIIARAGGSGIKGLMKYVVCFVML